MNLKQQFFWKVLIGLSIVMILFSIFNSYSKYSELGEYQLEYKKESQVKDNKNMERKTNFISENQNERIVFKPDLVSIVEKTITSHTRAGIKTDSKTDWESNEPIFRGVTNNRAMIDYRTSKGKFYKKGQKIKDTDMIIESYSRDSVLIKYPTGIRVFYVESYQELKK
tara:strand:- start:1378 stop:1881 length:504 start_codon:yes stop_codon:yes gene_type:complete